MTDDERIELFDGLAAAFRSRGLGWVVDEVTSLIAEGNEEVVTGAEWTGTGRPTKGDTRTTRREYSSLEQVELLIDAIARVIVDSVAVEESVSTFFAKESTRLQDLETERLDGEVRHNPDDTALPNAPLSSIRFVPEPSNADADTDGFVIGGFEDRAERFEATRLLVGELDRVRSEARL